jgi:hypothetical protein
VVLGLFWQRTRRTALLGVAYPVFFLVYHAAGRGVAISYYAASVTFGLIAAGFALDEAIRRAPRLGTRRGVAVAGCVLLLVQAVNIVVPLGVGWKPVLTAPMSRNADASLAQTYAGINAAEDELWAGLAFVDRPGWDDVFYVDSRWHDAYFPLPERSRSVRLGYTHYADQDVVYLDRIAPVIENMTDVTLMVKAGHPANAAIRYVYQDCLRFENAQVVVIEGPLCKGRVGALHEAYENVRAGREPGTDAG